MTQRRRIELSAKQRTEMWSRWKVGQSLREIGRAFGKCHVVIHFLLARHGGIAPDRIALRLNQRPRKTLGFETPESRLQASVASTP
jgi:IS30 family transposase